MFLLQCFLCRYYLSPLASGSSLLFYVNISVLEVIGYLESPKYIGSRKNPERDHVLNQRAARNRSELQENLHDILLSVTCVFTRGDGDL